MPIRTMLVLTPCHKYIRPPAQPQGERFTIWYYIPMNASEMDEDYLKQIDLAGRLLQTVRHAAYATVNADGTPHNSPLMLIYNEDLTRLYIGSYSESLHVKNLVRTGKAFAVIYDSFTKGQGGVYITGVNAHECAGDELAEALRVHNSVRAKHGSRPIETSFYESEKPSQRMYSIDIAKIEIYSVKRSKEGFIASEARIKVDAKALLPLNAAAGTFQA